MNIKRFAAASGTAVLLAFSLTACGDDAADAPDDASAEDFCEVWSDNAVGADASAEDQVDAAKEQADKLTETGTPDDMSDDQREGFEIFVGAIKDFDEDDVKTFENAEGEDDFKDAFGIDDDEFAKVSSFLEYAGTTCSDVEVPEE